LSEIEEGTGISAGYVGENCKLQSALNMTTAIFMYIKSSNETTYTIISVDLRDSPAGVLFIETLTLPFFACIIQIPPVELPLRRRRLITKRIKLIQSARFACPLLYTIKDLLGPLFTGEIEAHEGKVSTPEANRGELAGGRGSRAQSAKRDDRIGDPELFRSDSYTFGGIFARDKGSMRED
jgi:hypothetical protein